MFRTGKFGETVSVVIQENVEKVIRNKGTVMVVLGHVVVGQTIRICELASISGTK